MEISYDPIAPETLTVSFPDMEPFAASPIRIGEYCDKVPSLPEPMQDQTPATSRFLEALERKSEGSRRKMTDAISYTSLQKEVSGHV